MLLGLILAVTTAETAICAWLSFRSLPSTLRSEVDNAASLVGNLQSDWEVTKLNLETVVTSLEDLHERVKRTKASNRSVQQRIELSEATNSEADPRQDLRRRAGITWA